MNDWREHKPWLATGHVFAWPRQGLGSLIRRPKGKTGEVPAPVWCNCQPRVFVVGRALDNATWTPSPSPLSCAPCSTDGCILDTRTSTVGQPLSAGKAHDDNGHRMPLFKSLRSKSSRKSSASVASDAESATDFGPHSPSSATYGSVRSAKGGPTDYTSASKRSLNKTASSAPSSPPSALPRYTSSSSIRGDHGARGGSDAQNASMMGTLAEVNSSSTGIDAKPKPSDLFAGKGVQWDAVHLAGPNTSPATVGRTSNNEELQNFLKM